MSSIDVEALLQPISEAAPCGENLEYETIFQELERAAQGKPETQFSEAEPPDWKQVRSKALELLGRSKDLRAVVLLGHAVLELEGWPAFSDSLALLQGLLERYWEQAYPQLDPDDNDPTFRVNAIVALCHPEGILQSVRTVPLVNAPRVGRFSLRDIEIVTGKLSVNLPEDERPKLTELNAAYLDCDLDTLQATDAALVTAADSVRTIESILTEQLGASQAPDLSDLGNDLRSAHKILAEQLAARGVKSAAADDAVATETGEDAEAAADGAATPGGGPVRGEIRNREDIVQLLDKICDYYSRFEPASPVPILLTRAKRLVHMDFLTLLRDLAPDAVAQVEALRGQTGEASE